MAKPKKKEEQEPGTSVQKTDAAAMILVGDKHDLSHLNAGNRGSEQVGMDDLVIPRLEIVQSQSPCLDKSDPGYIPGAAIGDLVNSVTNTNYGREVFVVPVHYTKQWLVWKDRKQGGGFFGAYPNPQEAADRVEQEGGKEKGVESIDTPTHLCLLVDTKNGTVDEIIVSMPRTKAKVSRNWNAMIKLTGQDRFARVYRIATAQEKNKRGETYQNYVIAQSGFPAKALYARAENLYKQISAGQRNVVMDTKNYDAGEPAGGDSEM